MHDERGAAHAAMIHAMIHVTALARLAHSSFPGNVLLDVGTQVPYLIAQLANFDPVPGIVSSQQLYNYRL